MRKVVIHEAGGWDRLRVEDHPDPEPGPGELRVRTAAVGVNFADCVVRMGLYASAKKYVGWPITPGFDLAGRVDAIGEGVEPSTLGREVLGVTRFGGYSTHVVVPAAQVFDRPTTLGVPEAAAFPTVWLTAWYAVRELVRLRPGMRMLVHSAAGGVGGALLQLGRLSGCRVTGVVGSSHKVASALALGAESVIDRSETELWGEARRLAPGGWDVILDAGGVANLREGFEQLAPGGRLVVYGFANMLSRGRDRPSWPRLIWGWLRNPRFSPMVMTEHNRSVLAFNLSFLFDRTALLAEAMGDLLALQEAGELLPAPLQVLPLDQVAEAHRLLESGGTQGKLVLATDPDLIEAAAAGPD